MAASTVIARTDINFHHLSHVRLGEMGYYISFISKSKNIEPEGVMAKIIGIGFDLNAPFASLPQRFEEEIIS